MNKNKKGFTLVELLVVIAILAILAAVSVVGYLSFTNKAKESNDVSLTTQMNTVLQANEATKKPQTLKEVVKQLNEDGGIKLEVITPNSQGYNYAWDKASNRILLLDGTSIVAPNDVTDTNKADTIIIVKDEASLNDALNNGYGIALASSYNLVTTYADTNTSFKLEKAVSFDDYNNLVSNLEITNTEANNIYISGDFISLKVDTKSDISIYGKCNKLDLTNGNIKVEDNTNITTINAENASEAKVFIANNGTVGNIVGEENILAQNSKIPTDGYPSKPKEEDKYFQSGSGTKNNPYIITTVEQFKNINHTSDVFRYYKLNNDLSLNDESNLVAEDKKIYVNTLNGVFDGNNKKINFEYLGNYSKLFAKSSDGSELKDLKVNYIKSEKDGMGGAYIVANPNDTFTFNNVDLTGEMNYNYDARNQSPYMNNALGDNVILTFKNCDVDMQITAESYNAVFVGDVMNNQNTNKKYYFESCTYKGSFKGRYAGFLFGNTSNYETIESVTTKDCVNYGTLVGIKNASLAFASSKTDKDQEFTKGIENKGSLLLYSDEGLSVENNNNKLVIEDEKKVSIDKYKLTMYIYVSVYVNNIYYGTDMIGLTFESSNLEEINNISVCQFKQSSNGLENLGVTKNHVLESIKDYEQNEVKQNDKFIKISKDGKSYYYLKDNQYRENKYVVINNRQDIIVTVYGYQGENLVAGNALDIANLK